jgi:adenosylmethionine-8-amino-7-oxononanoate aminotransferase
MTFPAKLPKVSHGSGSYVFDTDGKRYIDGSGGPAVYCLGYSHPDVLAAIDTQMQRVMHGYRYTFTSDPLEELTELLTRQVGGDLCNVVYVSGGSEAVESSLKLALQYHAAKGEMSRRRFISRKRSWHGNTLGALSVSHFKERRDIYEGALLDVSFLSPVNTYRPPPGIDPEDVAEFCAQELEQEISRLGEDKIAAFIFEPVVGAAGGVVPAPKQYAARIREICSRHDIVMIADEVMCGAGRCGTFRALEHDGAMPDIMPIAKGLAAGYVPLGAALYGDKIREAIDAAYGGPLTGHTFSGHTVACAAGVAVQKVIEREDLLQHVSKQGEKFLAELKGALASTEAVGDVRGRGYFIGIEFVRDRRTKAPFSPDLKLHQRIREATFANGLICYPCCGNVDGTAGDTVIIAPPYNATDAELEEILDKLSRALKNVVKSIGH